MAEINELIIKYRADISELKAKIQEIENVLRKAQSTGDSFGKGLGNSAKQSIGLIENLRNRINALTEAQTKNSDPSRIQRYNQILAEQNQRLSELTGKTKEVTEKTNPLATAFEHLGRQILVAFSVERIIAFGAESVQAFRNSQLVAEQLTFAVKNIGQEGDIALKKLVSSAEKFSKISIFSETQIKQSIAALSTFGLTSDEIEKLLPNVIGAGSKMNDLAGATQLFIRAIKGQAGRGELTTLGIAFDDTGTKVGNFNTLIQRSSKLLGETDVAFKSSAGQAAFFANETERNNERVGKSLDGLFLKFSQLKTNISGGLAVLLGDDVLKTNRAFELINEANTKANQFTQDQIEVILKSGLRFKGFLQNISQDFVDTATLIARAGEGINVAVAGAIDSKDQKRIVDTIVALNAELLKQSSTTERGRAQSILFRAAILELTEAEEKLKNSLVKFPDLVSLNIEALKKLKDELTAKPQTNIVQDEIAAIDAEIKRKSDAAKKGNEQAIKDRDELRDRLQKQSDAAFLASARDEVQNLEIQRGLKQQDAQRTITDKKALNQILLDIDKEFEPKIVEAQKKLDDAKEKQRQEDAKVAIKNLQDNLQKTLDALDILSTKQKITVNTEFLSSGATGTEAEQERQKKLDKIDEDANQQKLQRTKNTDDEINKLNGGVVDNTAKLTKAGVDAELKASEDKIKIAEDEAKRKKEIAEQQKDILIQIGEEITAAIFASIHASFDAQIQSQTEANDLNIKAFDDQLAKLDESRTKDYVSEMELKSKQKVLLDQRTAAEKRAADEIAKIKTQQAIADKAAAIINIVINTAKAIVAAYAQSPAVGIALTPFLVALGVTETAIVAATPIPKFAKGTKSSPEGVSIVGERGAEMIWMPQGSKVLPAPQTAHYADYIEAMRDNKLNDVLNKTYIAPALQALSNQYEIAQQQTFATNVANSFMLANVGLSKHDLEYVRAKGMNIKNADEIAEAIADKINYNPESFKR